MVRKKFNDVHAWATAVCRLPRCSILASPLSESKPAADCLEQVSGWNTKNGIVISSLGQTDKLENVAIANALQLEAAGRCAVPIRFNFVARAKFELAQPIRCRLRVFLLLIRCVTLWPRTLTAWPWPLTFDLERASNGVPNLSWRQAIRSWNVTIFRR